MLRLRIAADRSDAAFAASRGRLQGGLCGSGSRQQAKPAACAINGPRQPRRWRREESRRRPATSTRRWRRPKEAEALAKASIFQATQRKGSLERRWKYADRPVTARRDRMTIRRRDFLKACGCCRALARTAAARAQRRERRRLRSRALRQCAHPAHDRYACAAAAGVFSRAQRQHRRRRDGRASRRIWSASAFLERFGIRPDSADAYAFTCLDFEKAARALRQARRLRASEDAGRSPAQRRRRRALAAARRRRPLAGHRTRQHHAGRRHGRGRESARHRGDDRPLGIHLWREGAARQSRALQGRIPGAERLPDRGGRLQRRQGVRSRLRPRIQAVGHQGDRRRIASP